MKKIALTALITIISITAFNIKISAQCSQDLIYNNITETAKKDTLILLRDLIFDNTQPEQNIWTISLRENTTYRIYFFTETENSEMILTKITKKEKTTEKILNGKADKKFIQLQNKKNNVYQIQIKSTDYTKKCIMGAIFVSNKSGK